jgi:hypothetical protein
VRSGGGKGRGLEGRGEVYANENRLGGESRGLGESVVYARWARSIEVRVA